MNNTRIFTKVPSWLKGTNSYELALQIEPVKAEELRNSELFFHNNNLLRLVTSENKRLLGYKQGVTDINSPLLSIAGKFTELVYRVIDYEFVG